MVKISMDTFVKRFQPAKYDDWINGTDIGPHPEDPVTEAAAAPTPSDQDILVNKKYLFFKFFRLFHEVTQLLIYFSNVDVPAPFIQSLKKKCNPSLKTKSFKERNPDLDMEEIQNNPNIPDDIKAVLNGSVLDEAEGVEEPVACLKDGVEAIIQEKYDDIFNEDSDEEMIRSRRGRKSKKDDDDWFANKKERMAREKMINGPKPRGRPKRKSDEATEDKVKRKKPTPKKKEESTRKSTDGSKTQPEKGRAKKPPALPFNLLDLTKKFEGKIPSLKNPSPNPVNDLDAVKKVVVELVNPKASTDKLKLDKSTSNHNSADRTSLPGNSFISSPSIVTYSNSHSLLKQTASMQNGLNAQPRTTLSSTISSKDVKTCEIKPSKYSLKV